MCTESTRGSVGQTKVLTEGPKVLGLKERLSNENILIIILISALIQFNSFAQFYADICTPIARRHPTRYQRFVISICLSVSAWATV